MALPEAWSIKARAHQCAITEVKFVDQQQFYTAIFPDPESSGYLRMDFSLEGWKDRPEELQKPFSFWKNTYEASVIEAKSEVVTKESAEELLSRLIEEDQEHTENARYILAVMLERKKLLKETDKQQTPNGILRIYEHRKNGEIYIVLDPNIPLDKVEAVQKEVSELLDGNDRKQQKAKDQAENQTENKAENEAKPQHSPEEQTSDKEE
ncbi:MAG: hypothetical protein ACSHX6_06995 [Akkermansiaceae bacterium]